MNATTKNPLNLTATAAAAFHFRGISMLPNGVKGGRTKAQEAEYAAHPEMFEEVESRIRGEDGKITKVRQLKRKSVEVTIQYPDFLLELTDPAVQVLVKNAIDRFAKLNYIDEFKDVGDHDWATVGKSIVDAYNNAGSSSSAPDDAVLEIAQSVWNAVIASIAPALAAHSTEWIAKRCTDASISKMLGGNVTEARLRKIGERVAQVAATLDTEEGKDFASAAPAFRYASERINAMLAKMTELDDDSL